MGLFTLSATGVHRSFPLDPSTFAPVRDLAFAAPLSAIGSSADLRPDSNENAQRSSLALLENGRALGPAHSLHETVWTSGRGAFSHWGDSVVFSTSDNSDPRVNGRRYEVAVWVPLSAPIRRSVLLVAAAALALLAWTLRSLFLEGFGRQGGLWRVVLAVGFFFSLDLIPDVSTRPWLGTALILSVAGLSGIAIHALRRSPTDPPPRPMPSAWAWAAAALSLLPPLLLLQYLSTPVFIDSFSYWLPADALGRRFFKFAPVRTPLIPAIHALLDAAGAQGITVIVGQVLVRSLAVLVVTRAMGRRHFAAGVVTGVFLALDPVSSALTLVHLSESLHSSAWLIVLGLLLAFRAGGAPRPVVFGIALGIAGLVRTVGLPMAVVTLLVAAVLARSRAWALRAAFGVVAVFSAAVTFNLVHTGHAWGSQGTFMAFPLFIQKQFSPSNGPASGRIHADLLRCGLDNLEQEVDLNSSNEIILSRFNKCLAPESATIGNRERIDRDYSQAYREALFTHPINFTWAMIKESLRFLAFPVSMNPVADRGFAAGTDVDEFCAPRNELPFMASFRVFVCPLPYPDKDTAGRLDRLAQATRLFYQPFLYFIPRTADALTPPVAAGAAALIWMVWLAWVAPVTLRLPLLVSSLLILLNAGGTALGQAAMLRYVAPTGSLFLMLTAVFMATAIDFLLGDRWPRRTAGAPPGLSGSRPAPRLRPTLLMVAALASAIPILFVEVALRILDASSAAPAPALHRDPRLGWDSLPRVKTVGTGQEAVLFVGDSFTQGQAWPESALRLLRESGGPALGGSNLGVAGFGTTQEWIKTRDWMDENGSRPRAIVLLVFTWNDLRDNLAAPSIYYNHQTRRRPYWRRASDGWELSTPFFWPDLFYNTRITERLVRLIDERAAARNLARRLDGIATVGADVRLGYADPRSWDPFYRTGAQASAYVSRAWESTEKALVEFQNLARERDVPLIVMALDNGFTVDRDVLDQWVPQKEGFDPLLPLARLAEVAAKLRLDFTNLQPRLDTRARVAGGKIYNGPPGNLSGHLEPQGNDEVARAAAEALARVLAAPRP